MFNRICIFIILIVLNISAHAGSWQSTSLGGFSNVDIYTPDSTSSIGQGRSLLIVLHGCAQAISAFRTANLEQAAETYGMVIAVPDAENKAGFSCWSYWQGVISRNAGDYRNLIQLAGALTADASKAVDADQVYVAGLSSGATFANTVACLAPDVFAGVGVSAGPSIGTSSSGAIGTCEQADVASRCLSYAGSNANHFSTQLTSIAHARNDTTVNTCYNEQNAQGMASVYGVNQLPGSMMISDGQGGFVEEFAWEDQRVRMLWFENVGHAWSGGAGASGSFISGNSVNYASYLGAYFSANNKRVSRNQPPVLDTLTVTEVSGRIDIQGQASDPDDALSHVAVMINNAETGAAQDELSIPVAANGSFSALSALLPDALYEVSVLVFDQEGAASEMQSVLIRIGPEPAPQAPEITQLEVLVDGSCVAIAGRVFDINNDVTAVEVQLDDLSPELASLTGVDFSYSRCDLAAGLHQALVVASDAQGLMTSTSQTFEVDAGVTAVLQTHIDQGRLDFTAYANCYLAYGSSTAFRLDEVMRPDGQCEWTDGMTCTGPVQACSGSSGNEPPEPPPVVNECEEVTNFNYYHKLAGRAYSEGSVLTPDYFAIGSDDALAGSTWGSTTVHQIEQGIWLLGSCP